MFSSRSPYILIGLTSLQFSSSSLIISSIGTINGCLKLISAHIYYSFSSTRLSLTAFVSFIITHLPSDFSAILATPSAPLPRTGSSSYFETSVDISRSSSGLTWKASLLFLTTLSHIFRMATSAFLHRSTMRSKSSTYLPSTRNSRAKVIAYSSKSFGSCRTSMEF